MINIKDISKRIDTINEVLKYLKLDILTDKEKNDIYNLVISTKKTELQKRRFIMFYSLGPNSKEHNTYKKIANFYDCSMSAIRASVSSVVVSLYHLPDEKFNILENILKKYKK